MTKKAKAIVCHVWQATVHYQDGKTETFLPENQTRFKTPTPYMNSGVFTKYEAHYAAFGQAGFHIKSIDIKPVRIAYNKTSKTYEVTG